MFLVLGLQLPYILKDIEGISKRSVLLDGVLFSAAVILLRFLWILPGEWLFSHIRPLRKVKARRVSAAEAFLLGWAGMRGVLSLAAAFSLPERLSNGEPFPYRDLIIFLTFCIIFSTLVVQGLTMPMLIRLLGLSKSRGIHEEERNARREMTSSALQRLETIREDSGGEPGEVFDYFEALYRERLAMIEGDLDGEPDAARIGSLMKRLHVGQQLRDAERSVAINLRNQNKIHEEVLRRLEYELDLLDARFVESE